MCCHPFEKLFQFLEVLKIMDQLDLQQEWFHLHKLDYLSTSKMSCFLYFDEFKYFFVIQTVPRWSACERIFHANEFYTVDFLIQYDYRIHQTRSESTHAMY
eukprot:UN26388